ncbi:hypothetical protein AQUCO_02700025v1 [Aquilegia coerulea]|uniref:Major facilitator superfamily (MFS) profile domain-containing protein n=1 Tax=Aquilegia coerulea TaxID=218851 RepID=A0A2G5D4U1_AQUCA|nr:hypothetical protein AQUCO_02700025v1 [Aquilegia coerulea]
MMVVQDALYIASREEFKDLFHIIEKKDDSYVIKHFMYVIITGAFSCGHNMGLMIGTLLYIRDQAPEIHKKTSLQEAIVSMSVAGAILGAVLGGSMKDKFGRKRTIMASDILIFFGTLLLVCAPVPWLWPIVVGRILVGLGLGIASMTVSLYISETSPVRIRGALVSLYGLAIIGGQFFAEVLAYLIYSDNMVVVHCLFGVAGIPMMYHFLWMLGQPESPVWLYRKGREEEAINVLKGLCLAEELDVEIDALKLSVKAAGESSIDAGNIVAKVKDAWDTPVVRKGLAVGIGVQIFQQLVGINAVMHYGPTIVQFAGIASSSKALALSLITSGLNAVGTITCMSIAHKYGRKKMMIISMIGIISCLGGLSVAFKISDAHAPIVNRFETARFGNGTCPVYLTTPNTASWDCRLCLDASSGCAFCFDSTNLYHAGACIAIDSTSKAVCHSQGKSELFTQGCPSNAPMVAIIFLVLFIISYSFGMGTVPWIVNSEIYPLQHRGICQGMATMANWISSLIVIQTFLTLTKAFGPRTFLIYAGFSTMGMLYIVWIVPETKGLLLEEVEEVLEAGNMFHSWKKPWPLEERAKLLPSKPYSNRLLQLS